MIKFFLFFLDSFNHLFLLNLEGCFFYENQSVVLFSFQSFDAIPLKCVEEEEHEVEAGPEDVQPEHPPHPVPLQLQKQLKEQRCFLFKYEFFLLVFQIFFSM